MTAIIYGLLNPNSIAIPFVLLCAVIAWILFIMRGDNSNDGY